jgi:quinoprotein glucose dehydrogenase
MLYAQQCLFCHGVNRQGNPLSMVPALTGIATRTARDVAEGITQTGKGFMPSFKHIEPDKMKALLDYLYKADEAAAPSAQAAQRAETLKPQYQFTGYNRFVDPLGYPAITPPWGSLNAIDMNTGEILWKVVLGDTPELKHLRHEPTGAENYGGPVITKGGVLFIAATKDEMFRAFDKKTGALLWETKLPAGGYATPSVYEVGGTQYVVIAAGGGKIGTAEGDQFLAFKLRG